MHKQRTYASEQFEFTIIEAYEHEREGAREGKSERKREGGSEGGEERERKREGEVKLIHCLGICAEMRR